MTNLKNKRTRAASSLRKRREGLGLSRPQTAALADLSLTTIANAESFGSPKTCARINAALDKYEQRQAVER